MSIESDSLEVYLGSGVYFGIVSELNWSLLTRKALLFPETR